MTHRAWEKVLDRMREHASDQAVETWLRPLRFVTREGSQLLLSAPHQFFKLWVEENYLTRLVEAASKEFGDEVSIDISVGTEDDDGSPGTFAPPTAFAVGEDSPARARVRENGLVPKYTFDLFVVGAGNQFAHAAAFAVATEPAKHYNPLFIYGGVGLGKTHLLHAIGNHALSLNGQANVCYITAEKFTNELIACIRTNRMHEFKEKYRSADMLLVDDVQFIAGKQRTQEEFFHTFNDLYSSHKQIVVSSDKFPKEIPDLEERIQSRFEWGLVADIQVPDMETRVAILTRKAEIEGIPLPQDVALLLASTIKTNIRELEGTLIRIGAHASINRRVIDTVLAREVLSRYIESSVREISPDSILKAVSDRFGVKIADLRSERKHKIVALPRQVAMYLIRRMTKCSYPDIGQRFGGKDHSTVMYAVKKIEQKLKDDVSLRNTVAEIRRKIEG